jgi:hypothetical protein
MRHTISTGSTIPQYFVQQPVNNVFLRTSLPSNQPVKQVMSKNQNYTQAQQLQVAQPVQPMHQIIQAAQQMHQVRVPQHFPQSQILAPIYPGQQNNKNPHMQSPHQQVAHYHQLNQHNIQINPTL